VLRALRYAGSLRPTDVRAVHFRLDGAVADQLQDDWIERKIGDRVPLEIVDCPDRRLVHSITQLALDAVVLDRAEVTILLPRRTFGSWSQRLLHDRTADRIAEAVGRIPHVAATIVPFDTTLPHAAVEAIESRQLSAAREPALPSQSKLHDGAAPPARAKRNGRRASEATPPIGSIGWRQRVTIEGRVRLVQPGTAAGKCLEVQVYDDTGGMRLLFFGRTCIPGIDPGTVLRATGRVGEYKGHLAIANPSYELISVEPAHAVL
jgi:hypothetical protein